MVFALHHIFVCAGIGDANGDYTKPSFGGGDGVGGDGGAGRLCEKCARS